jgi:hypothetical protein
LSGISPSHRCRWLCFPLTLTAAWCPSIEDFSTLKLFTDFYAATQPPLSNMALECLVGGAGAAFVAAVQCRSGRKDAGCTTCLCVWYLLRWLYRQYTALVCQHSWQQQYTK